MAGSDLAHVNLLAVKFIRLYEPHREFYVNFYSVLTSQLLLSNGLNILLWSAAAKEREERQRKREAITKPPERTDGMGDRVVLYTQVLQSQSGRESYIASSAFALSCQTR